MRLTLMFLFLPSLVISQNTGALITSNSNSRIIFSDNSILPGKVVGLTDSITALRTGINAKQNSLGFTPSSQTALSDSGTAIQSRLNAKVSLTGSEVITGKTLGAFNYAADAGANDSYVITLSPAPASYTTGMMIVFKANTANTTGCTINVNSLGAKTIVKRVNTTPATGDILQAMLCWLVYDGQNFVLLNPVVN